MTKQNLQIKQNKIAHKKQKLFSSLLILLLSITVLLLVDSQDKINKIENTDEVEIHDKDVESIKKYMFAKGLLNHNENLRDTIPFITFLDFFIQEYKISSIADFTCGKWEYMRYANIPKETSYSCFDFDKQQVAENNQIFGNYNTSFHLIDNYLDIPPKDLLIIKNVFNYLPNDFILLFLNTIIPKYQFVLFIHTKGDPFSQNQETKLGQYRGIDLSGQPFAVQNLKLVFEYENSRNNRVLIQLLSNKK